MADRDTCDIVNGLKQCAHNIKKKCEGNCQQQPVPLAVTCDKVTRQWPTENLQAVVGINLRELRLTEIDVND
jgi:hypothetical protein